MLWMTRSDGREVPGCLLEHERHVLGQEAEEFLGTPIIPLHCRDERAQLEQHR